MTDKEKVLVERIKELEAELKELERRYNTVFSWWINEEDEIIKLQKENDKLNKLCGFTDLKIVEGGAQNA